MFICQCGCNKEIPYSKWHESHPPRFIKGHNTPRGPHLNIRYSSRRVPPGGIPCACGCGAIVTEYKPGGGTRYQRAKDGKFYLPNHNPVKRGPQSHKWKGGRCKNGSGYILISVPDHRDANKDGYVLEHRYIWEMANRPLRSNEDVHHINGIKDDNRIENLVALTKSKHRSLEVKKRGGIPTTKESCRRGGKLGAKARWG